ncbi:MAG TPA: protein-glutamate O-methyltransferase CheR [Gammaproteobacteria bacterium]
MPLTAIEQLLKHTMGLNAASIGSSAINRAVQQRMRELGLTRPEEYLPRLRASGLELAELIDLVVVPETWFFRDRHPFIALARCAREFRSSPQRIGPLRILSVPCSTGEEPYTIVMSLLDSGLQPGDFRIDAVDISEPNLERARAGLYREHSFRGDDLGFRDRYFLKSEHGYLLQAEVRGLVNLHHANLLAADFFANAAPYDVVFCRNLLIYFDRETQARALSVLERLLAPHGLLFLGHAEAGVLAGRAFVSLDHPRSFAFVRGSRRSPEQLPAERMFKLPQRRRQPAPTPARTSAPRPFSENTLPPQQPAAPIVAEEPAGELETATRLANEGHLVEAARLCETHLQQHGPDAQAFYLLALMREAVGEAGEAESLLRKAIYLDPQHYEALTHLALLLQQRGDGANAALMQQRANRSFERQQDEAARRAGDA